ncbi:putative fungal-specific transcription factor [Aspergillus steynii IBT 23096]|uniref:Putative fungal-specific transcription factor n=1 Tax=Aspergillus steynii IBT 23096 TaxID=1392250 RepID=A0A2I2GNQ8_9EURO|nr:putative fungal-specific transcription factor [Aspergillus steynii IBT 23096]PLB54517.1 putative fungal-specific transcription factor [Aspergillus steynii IBT 23096]
MPPKAAGDWKRRTTARQRRRYAAMGVSQSVDRVGGDHTGATSASIARTRIMPAPRAGTIRYVHALHQRIRELEENCLRAGVSIRMSSNSQPETSSGPNSPDRMPPEGVGVPPTAFHAPLEPAQNPTPTSVRRGAPGHGSQVTHGGRDNRQSEPTGEGTAEAYESPFFDDSEGHVTGMGQIIAPGSENRGQFYGSSSTASLMRFASELMPSRPTNDSRVEPIAGRLQDTSTIYRLDDFVLPPRTLADHLLNCFFDHVYILYPFFDRPAFEAAYRNLWRAEDEPNIALTDQRIGLGSRAESGPKSIVFHSALNCIFALGCQFADIASEEVELVANSFFLRAKRFIGLDFLDINTLGVVQALLITALFLQSSPYPSRCWQSVGVACRVALGLGLHESDTLATLAPLESDIRRRTWHGCVMMDVTLSMTYGRPSMTSHLAPFPPPSDSDVPCHPNGPGEPSLMAFYTESIKVYDILDRILSDVYYTWRGRSRQDQLHPSTRSLGGLDTVLEIERQLTLFEANLPSFLKWTLVPSGMSADGESTRTIAKQRNVLHARYIHLHLLLYRPIFTQLYSARVSKQENSSRPEFQKGPTFQSCLTQSAIYSSVASKCASACVMAAADLTHLVHETYRTDAADAWWYNGFYVSTAAIVLLMSLSAPSMLDPFTMDKAREAWKEAMRVLESMASFRRSATNTLQFLQGAYRQAVPGDVHQTGTDVTGVASQLRSDVAQLNDTFDHPVNDPTQIPFFNWEEFAASMGPGLDDLGFLTRLDFPDCLG